MLKRDALRQARRIDRGISVGARLDVIGVGENRTVEIRRCALFVIVKSGGDALLLCQCRIFGVSKLPSS